MTLVLYVLFFFSSRRRHTRFDCDWSSDVCSSDLGEHNHPDPDYREHFAVSDIEPGEYTLAVAVGGRRMTGRVHVEADRVTWVGFGAGAPSADRNAAPPGASRSGVPRVVHGRSAQPIWPVW